MSLMLAPYNDSMRLGMGFNSYTQDMCIDKAVVYTDKQVVRADNPSQVVTYTSKCVTRLSDVVSSMNVSYSTSIKKGTVEVAGSSNTINETKIKESDINAVVSVKVVNQTTIVDETCVFKPVDGIFPGTADFNDRFGDCYISGFIEGGDFNGIVSMKVLDRSKVDEVVSKIKRSLGSGGEKSEFTLDMDAFSGSSNSSGSEINQDTEATVSVAWMGGGQIKDPSMPWNMTSVFTAAAEFPSNVAKVPQKTWAILTKYKANRSFVEWSSKLSFTPLEYDAIASYTAELFDNYMEYKQLLKLVEDMITSPEKYKVQAWKTNNIPLVVPTLVAVKSAFRIEMSKIVNAVDILSKDPHALKQATGMNAEPADDLVRRIVRQAQEGSSSVIGPQPTSGAAPTSSSSDVPPATTSVPGPSDPPTAATTSTSTASDASGGIFGSSTVAAAPPSATVASNDSSGGIFGSSTVAAAPPSATVTSNNTPAPAKSKPSSPDSPKFDPKTMIAPEIWADLLPTAIDPTAAGVGPATGSVMPSSLASLFPPAPASDLPPAKDAVIAAPSLRILSAACGIADVTDTITKLVKDDALTFQASAVQGFLDGHAKDPELTPALAFVYQYGNGPMRLCTAKYETVSGSSDTTTTYKITKDNVELPELTPTAWNADTWSFVAVVYGTKFITDSGIIGKLQDQVRTNWNGGKGIRRLPVFSNDLMGGDPWPNVVKTSMVFYQAIQGGQVKCTVGKEWASNGVLTDDLTVMNADPRAMGLNSMTPSLKPRVTRIATSDFKMQGTTDMPNSILEFQNGVKFCFQADGNFVVYDGSTFKWATASAQAGRPNMNGAIIQWQADNKLCGYDNKGNCIMCINAGSITDNKSVKGEIVFADHEPYLEMGYYNGSTWVSTWKSP